MYRVAKRAVKEAKCDDIDGELALCNKEEYDRYSVNAGNAWCEARDIK